MRRKVLSASIVFGGCATGEAVITTAGNLPAKFVIHTVGPVWNGGQNNEPEKLSNCYRNSLRLAVENNLQTIAFPNISTGIYGYPKEEDAQIAIKTVVVHIENDRVITKVYFVCFDEENFQLYRRYLNNFTKFQG